MSAHEPPERSAQGESVWSTLTQRFQALIVARNKPRPFVVSEESPGQWTFSPEFQVRPCFDDFARDAGNRLGVSEGVDALDFWLDRLSYYLWRYANSDGLQIVTVGCENRRLIKDVLRSSSTFSIWLSQSPQHMLDIVRMHSSEPPPWNTIPEPDKRMGRQEGSNEGGEAWAAEENRKQETRRCIVQALRELGVPQDEWPQYIQAWHADVSQRRNFSYQVIPPPFQPPAFERLNQSLAVWHKSADEEWSQHCARFITAQKRAEELGIDEKIPSKRKSRRPGKTGRISEPADR